jgi:hypothetical protein
VPGLRFSNERHWIKPKGCNRILTLQDQQTNSGFRAAVEQDNADACSNNAYGLSDFILKNLSELLLLKTGSIKDSDILISIGADSLILTKLHNRAKREINASIRLSDLIRCKSVRELLNVYGAGVQAHEQFM